MDAEQMTEARPYTKSLQQLRATGLRPTRQRLGLARLLFDDGHKRHVTAEGLHRQAIAAGHKVSLATVYNTLRQFTGVGLLREIVVDAGRTYFDTNTGDHHHYYHEADGSLADIEDGQIAFSKLPGTPEGSEIGRIDVIVRIKKL